MVLVPERISDTASEPLVFLHIFKGAGTTIQLQLARHFGSECVATRMNDGETFLDDVHGVLKRNTLKFLCGHFRYDRISEAFLEFGYSKPKCFTFIRDPIDRYVSIYNYLKREPTEKWYREASRMDINEFLSFLVENHSEAIVNHQCLHLSEYSEAPCDAALANIRKNFLFVGRVEAIGKSGDIAERRIGMRFLETDVRNNSSYFQGVRNINDTAMEILTTITAEDRELCRVLGTNPEVSGASFGRSKGECG